MWIVQEKPGCKDVRKGRNGSGPGKERELDVHTQYVVIGALALLDFCRGQRDL